MKTLLLLLLLPIAISAQSRPTAGRIMGGVGVPSGSCNSSTTLTDVYIRTGVAPREIYLCSSSAWVLFASGGGIWGSITGTLSNQTDLQTALNLKAGLVANTFTGRQIISVNGASAAPPLSLTGTIFTGGGTTNTKPAFLVEPTGATSANWSNTGTLIGANAPSGFTGNLLDLQLNGAARLLVQPNGSVASAAALKAGASSSLEWDTRTVMTSPVNGNIRITNAATNDFGLLQLGGTTSSFPALKRNGTTLAHRLADDSADGPISTAAITASGSVTIGATNAFIIATQGFIDASANGVFRITNIAATDFGRLQFGGATSAFPSLKRTATNLGFRLADDSADAPMSASTGTFSGGVTATAFNTSATSAGTVAICEPTGTGSDCGTIAAPASITTAYTLTMPAATAGSSLVSYTVASGTSALGTSAISSATCASVVTTAATGTATTDVVWWGFNGDPTAVTGYTPVTTGALTIFAYPTANNVNYKVCNLTGASITPGAITLNWRIVR